MGNEVIRELAVHVIVSAVVGWGLSSLFGASISMFIASYFFGLSFALLRNASKLRALAEELKIDKFKSNSNSDWR